MDESFHFFVIFMCSKGKKQYANLVPSKFLTSWHVEVRDKISTFSYQKVKIIWKRGYIAFMHSKTRGKFVTLQKACEKVCEFKVCELVISFSISSPGSPLWSTLLKREKIRVHQVVKGQAILHSKRKEKNMNL